MFEEKMMKIIRIIQRASQLVQLPPLIHMATGLNLSKTFSETDP
jgi:hypothetical protein